MRRSHRRLLLELQQMLPMLQDLGTDVPSTRTTPCARSTPTVKRLDLTACYFGVTRAAAAAPLRSEEARQHAQAER